MKMRLLKTLQFQINIKKYSNPDSKNFFQVDTTSNSNEYQTYL